VERADRAGGEKRTYIIERLCCRLIRARSAIGTVRRACKDIESNCSLSTSMADMLVQIDTFVGCGG
jgi:hypothetical protein